MRGFWIVVICLLGFGPLANAAPKAELWAYWQTSNEENAAQVDHSPWQQLLDRYLVANHPSGITRFNYAAVSKSDLTLLADYLQQLQAIDPRRYAKAEQFAYWTNLYNALTVQRVLHAYPVDSILKVEGGIFRRGPWHKKHLQIANQRLSLNDIEHRILRPIWQDSRIHYAVNCASLGCPNLQPQVYRAEQIEQQLDQAAKDYLQHDRGVSLLTNGQLRLSKIFTWYQEDFGGSDEKLLETLLPYLSPKQQREVENYSGPIQYHYDWDLNQP